MLILFSGIPASGKSTTALEVVRLLKLIDKNMVTYISSDNVREHVMNENGYGQYSHISQAGVDQRIMDTVEAEVWGVIHYKINEAMNKSKLHDNVVILDSTNLIQTHINNFRKRYGSRRTTLMVMGTSYAKSVKRNRQRDRQIPQHVMERMWEQNERLTKNLYKYVHIKSNVPVDIVKWIKTVLDTDRMVSDGFLERAHLLGTDILCNIGSNKVDMNKLIEDVTAMRVDILRAQVASNKGVQ